MKCRVNFIALLFLFTWLSGGAIALTTPDVFKLYSSSVVTVYNLDKGERFHQGSGFFIDKTGLVLTNYHVIHDAKEIAVETEDEKMYIVRAVVAQDAELDLALLGSATPSNKIKPVTFAKSIPLTGSKIITIGTPKGFSHTLTDGIISSIKKGSDGDVIQFTAPVSPGSSGSPLFDEKGHVIGVVTAQVVDGQNLNFAVGGPVIRDFLRTRPSKTQRDIELERRAQDTSKTYRRALNGEVLYKAGEYKDTYIYRLIEPFKSTMPGSYGIHFWFGFTRPCEFRYAYSIEGLDIYLPPEDVMKATFGGSSVIRHGDEVGFFRNPANGIYSWFVDNSRFNGGNTTVWARPFKENELSKFDMQRTVVWNRGSKVMIITYEGYDSATKSIEFAVTDTRYRNRNSSLVTIKTSDLPGFFELGNGTIDIDHVETTLGSRRTVLFYDWEERPAFNL